MISAKNYPLSPRRCFNTMAKFSSRCTEQFKPKQSSRSWLGADDSETRTGIRSVVCLLLAASRLLRLRSGFAQRAAIRLVSPEIELQKAEEWNIECRFSTAAIDNGCHCQWFRTERTCQFDHLTCRATGGGDVFHDDNFIAG